MWIYTSTPQYAFVAYCIISYAQDELYLVSGGGSVQKCRILLSEMWKGGRRGEVRTNHVYEGTWRVSKNGTNKTAWYIVVPIYVIMISETDNTRRNTACPVCQLTQAYEGFEFVLVCNSDPLQQ
jgi:hypothetical protein